MLQFLDSRLEPNLFQHFRGQDLMDFASQTMLACKLADERDATALMFDNDLLAQWTAAWSMRSAVASARENSAAIVPLFATRMRSDRSRISGK